MFQKSTKWHWLHYEKYFYVNEWKNVLIKCVITVPKNVVVFLKDIFLVLILLLNYLCVLSHTLPHGGRADFQVSKKAFSICFFPPITSCFQFVIAREGGDIKLFITHWYLEFYNQVVLFVASKSLRIYWFVVSKLLVFKLFNQ